MARETKIYFRFIWSIRSINSSIYLAELVLAIEHLNSLGKVHRDLNSQKVLFNSNGHIKLSDFGLSEIANISSYRFLL